MKRLSAFFLAIILVLSLCACGAKPAEAPGTPNTEDLVTVNTTEEFLAALGTCSAIVLAPGTYDLSSSVGYGEGASEYYHWELLWDNQYQLVLSNLCDTVIMGSGREETKIVTAPRTAAVIRLEGCANLELSGMTIGHTVMAEACEGPVIQAYQCSVLRLNDLGLFGCGTIGLDATVCSAVQMTGCRVYDCSGAGISMYDCSGALISDTTFEHIGKDGNGWALFGISSCSDVVFSNCTTDGATVFAGLSVWNSQLVTFKECTFRNINAVGGMIDTNSLFEMEDCNWDESNVFSRWYCEGNETFVEENNPPFDPAPITAFQQEVIPATARPVSKAPQKQVKVKTVDELLDALDSNTEIILVSKLYDLTTATDYGLTGGKYYHWEDNYDGPQLVIKGIENLTIHANSRNFTTISAEPRYANVLQFENCKNVTLHGFTAGHTKAPGQCVGGVIRFENSQECLVDECGLFGCGTLGVEANGCTDIQVINTNIYECSYGGVEAYDCDGLTIAGCDFWSLGGEFFRLSNVKNVSINDRIAPEYYFGY